MSIDVNVQNDLVIVTESSEDITVNVSNARGADGVGVPTGGTTGQVLKKLSNTNYDTYWALDGGGVPYSGATGQVDLGNYDLKVQGLTIGKGNNSLVNNTALGHSTLLNATTGNYNTAVGYESLRNTTTGQYNTAVGQSSLFSNTTGGQNTALGLNALLSNTTGSSNVAVGLDTLQHITTGSSNTAIGYNAGSHITGGSTPNTTATNSVFIGRDSKANADGQTNQIVIGQNAVGNGSNTATFGNTATTANYFTGSINGGSFVKSGGTSSQFLKADGSVDSTTYVGGSGTSGQVAYWNGTSSQTGSSTFLWNAASSLLRVNGGIGVNRDAFGGRALDATGGGIRLTGSTNGTFEINGSNSSGSVSTVGGIAGINITDTSNARLSITGNSYNYEIQANADLLKIRDVTAGNIDRFIVHKTGNVAIGSSLTDGGQRLQVQGDAFIKGSGATDATNGLLIQNSSSSNIFNFRNDGTLLMSTVSGQTIPVINIVGRTSPINAASYIRVFRYGNSDSINQSAEIFGYWDDSNVTGFRFQNGLGTGGGVTFNFIPNGNVVTSNVVTVNQTFNPTSGTATIAQLLVSPTINQTGGANGITRGLYINPTLTAAADWRSIEWSNNSGWGLFGAGSAQNYLNGSLGIGSTENLYKLDVFGNARFLRSQNNATTLRVENATAGTAAQADIRAFNDQGDFFSVGVYSSTTTTYGPISSRSAFNYTAAPNGLAFMADNGTGSMRFSTGGTTERMRLTAAGRLLLGTTTESTFLLDVNGTARVSGATTLKGTTNNDTTVILQISQQNGNGRFFVNAAGQVGVAGEAFQSSETLLSVARNTFNPTSGTSTHNSIGVFTNINQTGGAYGITRGLFINPTLTAAADWRAIEVSTGVSVLAPSTTASATLRIPSGTAPTSPVNGDIWFDGTDLKIRVGGVTKTFTLL